MGIALHYVLTFGYSSGFVYGIAHTSLFVVNQNNVRVVLNRNFRPFPVKDNYNLNITFGRLYQTVYGRL